MSQELNSMNADTNSQLLNSAAPIPEVINARQVLGEQEKTIAKQTDTENKGIWTKIVMFLGALFGFIFSLPDDVKKQIAHSVVDSLSKKNEEKKKQLEDKKNESSK